MNKERPTEEVLAKVQEIKSVLISHSKELHLSDKDEEEFKSLLAMYNKYFEEIEASIRSSVKEADEAQQGLVEDYIDISKKYCDLMAQYEKEHEALEVLKDVLDFYFDAQKQTVSISKSNRITRGARVSIDIEDTDKFNMLKRILK